MYKFISKIKILTLLVPVVLLLASCEDWLQLKPENNVVKEDFWRSEQQVYSFTMGLYGLLLDNGVTSRFFDWGELRGDLLQEYKISVSKFNRILAGDITSYNSVCDWAPMYKCINQCNILLEYAKEAVAKDATFTEEELHAYEAEAYGIRALLYFYLARAFNDVPLMLDAVVSDDVDFLIPKNTNKEIFNQIYADIDSARKYALTDYGDVDFNKGRLTRYGIEAIAADVYLWNDDYEKCETACNIIINSNKFGLVSGENWFEEIFVKGNSNEGIFELQFSKNKTNPFYTYFDDNIGFFSAPSTLIEKYEGKDVRGDTATYIDLGLIYKYAGLSPIERVTRTQADYESNWIFYRYADILLLKAEALNEMGKGAGAVELVNKVQERAHASVLVLDGDENENITDLILTERQKEFAYEGKRWFDVLRNAKRNNYARKQILIEMIESYAPADQVDLIKSKYSDPLSHYFPIYYNELEVNKLLVQNEYYTR